MQGSLAEESPAWAFCRESGNLTSRPSRAWAGCGTQTSCRAVPVPCQDAGGPQQWVPQCHCMSVSTPARTRTHTHTSRWSPAVGASGWHAYVMTVFLHVAAAAAAAVRACIHTHTHTFQPCFPLNTSLAGPWQNSLWACNRASHFQKPPEENCHSAFQLFSEMQPLAGASKT